MNIYPEDNPQPIINQRDTEDSFQQPLFIVNNLDENNPIPIFPSEDVSIPMNGTNDKNSTPRLNLNTSSPVLNSKEHDSEATSMGVQYQSTVGSVNFESKEGRMNGMAEFCELQLYIEFGSRLNSPFMSGRAPEPSIRTLSIAF